ncbi:MAG: CD1375 family protein [Lachnospiraceae bacterium]|nr:CD1375 family protein [Lachnospiraceae bacterium]
MLCNLIIRILFGKDVEDMAVVYATLIIKGKKTFADVPVKIQQQVKEVLVDLGLEELAQ